MNLIQLRHWPFPVVEHRYDQVDTMRYALSLGVGLAPTDPHHLRYVYAENPRGLAVLPCMASILAYAGHWSRESALGLDWKHILHGEQRVLLHRPLASAGHVAAQTQIASVEDKGPLRGAVMSAVRVIRDQVDGQPIATVTMVTFLRGDGGNGGFGTPCAPLPLVPPGPPDYRVHTATSPQAGLLYRLEGDTNPVHADPAVAQAVGYPAPILHGLCTFGAVVHALIGPACGGDPAAIGELGVRFTAPVYPGESLCTEAWTGPSGRVHFRTTVPARGVTVLDRGILALR